MSFNPISLAIVIVLAAAGIVLIALADLIAPGVVLLVVAVVVLAALKMAQQWEKAVVLRAGKFHAVKGPGLFGVVPILDSVTALVDTRVRTTQFVAEQTLTKDTVPIDVDAIIFWIVTDARQAALAVADYRQAIAWAAQTSLREMIGAADLATLLSNRKAADEELRQTIDAKTEDWGINVRSVEIRDIKIPVALQDAMSRQAQAERERQARVILGTAEAEIAEKFVQAAETYANNPVALHLRGMNMLYESVKERGSTILVPSSALDTMNFGSVAGVTSLARGGGGAAASPPPAAPPPPAGGEGAGVGGRSREMPTRHPHPPVAARRVPPSPAVRERVNSQRSGEKLAGTTSMFSWRSMRPGAPPGGGQMPSLRAFSRISKRCWASL